MNAALAYLQVVNPKPEVPIETTIVGHVIVAVVRKLRDLEARTSAVANYNRNPDEFRGEPW